MTPLRLAVACALAVLVACGSGGPATCVEDAECPTGQGCHRGAVAGYCAPLCTRDSHCPDRIVCPGEDTAPGSSWCVDQGEHEGQGVCVLYVGGFTPATCTDAQLGCRDSASGGCTCAVEESGGTRATCAATDYPAAVCCAGTDYCSCRPFRCTRTGSSCFCGTHDDGDDRLALDSCSARGSPGSGVCCQDEYTCVCDDNLTTCPFPDQVVVDRCTADTFGCSSYTPYRVDRCDGAATTIAP